MNKHFVASTACAAAVAAAAAPDPVPPDGTVVVNGQALRRETIRGLETQYAVRVQPGRYWYDTASGAWGFEGGPTMGLIAAGMTLGGPLRADASGKGSGVFINGRELHPLDIWALSQLGPVWRGRWWVDARGTFGPEGGSAWGNLWLLAQQRQTRSPWGGYSRDGKHFLGRDSNGCMYYQGIDPSGVGATSYAPPGC